MTEAFTYCWTDHKTGKLYVGSHKGDPTDGYICSSKLMLQEYKIRPEDFSRQIIASGLFLDMRKLEEVILRTEDAAKSQYFYNQHNNDGKFYLSSHTEDAKRKISLSKIGKRRGDLSIRNSLGHTTETKLKISKNHADVSGENNPMFGKVHKDTVRKQISENRRGKGTAPRSEETKLKMSLARKLYWERKKASNAN